MVTSMERRIDRSSSVPGNAAATHYRKRDGGPNLPGFSEKILAKRFLQPGRQERPTFPRMLMQKEGKNYQVFRIFFRSMCPGDRSPWRAEPSLFSQTLLRGLYGERRWPWPSRIQFPEC
jgi:hypothetical protein